jgi:hypothetical protein
MKSTMPARRCEIAAKNFFRLAIYAARHGGFVVSECGGTANIIVGILSEKTGVTYKEAHAILNSAGKKVLSDTWYCDLALNQPWHWLGAREDEARWNIRTITKAACKLTTKGMPKRLK